MEVPTPRQRDQIDGQQPGCTAAGSLLHEILLRTRRYHRRIGRWHRKQADIVGPPAVDFCRSGQNGLVSEADRSPTQYRRRPRLQQRKLTRRRQALPVDRRHRRAHRRSGPSSPVQWACTLHARRCQLIISRRGRP